METPSSRRSSTRSQIAAATNNIPISGGKKEESEQVLLASSRKGEMARNALLDITNGSPIVGLAVENLGTPSSLAKNSVRKKQTPGSGESLLRGQAKTLLLKIEEGEIMKLPLEQRSISRFQGLMISPALTLLAPTPANTPFTESLPSAEDMDTKEEEVSKTSQFQASFKQEEALNSLENTITRALLFDSPGKSDLSDSSVISYEITYEGGWKSNEEDNSSVWSIQANASSQENEDGEDEVSDDGEKDEEGGDYEDEDGENGGEIEELCEEMSRICVENKIPEFTGRHTRFIYNSDDEIEGEEAVRPSVSPSVLRLKGLPTPKGKHMRFDEEEEK